MCLLVSSKGALKLHIFIFIYFKILFTLTLSKERSEIFPSYSFVKVVKNRDFKLCC